MEFGFRKLGTCIARSRLTKSATRSEAHGSSRFQVNHLAGLEAFLRAWDNKDEGAPVSDAPIEADSSVPHAPSFLSGHPVPILTRWHPRFADALEPGIRELVLELVDGLDCVTYSSCEGHICDDSHKSFSASHVGILPRDDREFARLFRILRAVAYATNAPPRLGLVKAVTNSGSVTSEDTTRRCIDIFFVPETADRDVYFHDVELVRKQFSKLVRAAKVLETEDRLKPSHPSGS